jgi:hypothetical protein
MALLVDASVMSTSIYELNQSSKALELYYYVRHTDEVVLLLRGVSS